MSNPESANQFTNYNKIYINGSIIAPFVGGDSERGKSVYFDDNDNYLGIVIRKMPENVLFFSNTGNANSATVSVDVNSVYKKIDMKSVLSTDELKDTEIYYSKTGEYIGNKSRINATMPAYKLVNKSVFIGGHYKYTVSSKKSMLQTNYPTEIFAVVLKRAIGDNVEDSLLDKNTISSEYKIVNGNYLPQDEAHISEFITNDSKYYPLNGTNVIRMT